MHPPQEGAQGAALFKFLGNFSQNQARTKGMRIALGNVPFEVAKIAAGAWRAGNDTLAREAFAVGLFPEVAKGDSPKGRIADLGTGHGDFAIALARRYSGCSIWAVDWDPISGLSGRRDLPFNLLNCSETGLDDFTAAVRSNSLEYGAPLLFDLVYTLFPNPSAIGAFLAAAMGVVSDTGEIHLVTEAPHVARVAEAALIQGGFLVRGATLPPEVGSITGYGGLLASSDTVHWVVARRYRPGEFVIPALGESPPAAWPSYFRIDGTRFQEHERHAAEVELSVLFGRPVGIDLLLNAVGIDVPGISLDQLVISPRQGGKVLLDGWFVDENNDRCGSFMRSTSPPPALGEPWIAEGGGFNAYAEHGKRITDKIKKGIARSWHQRFLPFLAWLGVDRLEFNATQMGSFAWARLGFDFRDEGVRDKVINEFRVWLAKQAPSPSLGCHVASLQHAWEVADVTGEDGRELGKEFLLQYGQRMTQGWAAVFSLHPSYPGWKRLFKDPQNSTTSSGGSRS